MLSDAALKVNLQYYEGIYNAAPHDLRVMLLASKASILEVCGWVEQAMDHLVFEAANRCSLSRKRIDWLKESYINKTYGFTYQNHFEKMIVAVVGYRILEQAEVNAGGVVPTMNGSLSQLTPLRNHYAHTHFDLANPFPKNMSAIPAPTTMSSHAQKAVDGLTELENQLIALGC
jgi:hypothetical protein